MLGKITDATPSVRRNTVLYLVGRAAVLAAVLLTLADIVRVYMAYGTEIAVGMMIPRMGALLGFSGSGVAGVLCTAVAFLYVIATALSVALAGRWYAWSIVALVLFSLDTLVTVWLFAASPSVGFLPALLCTSQSRYFSLLPLRRGASSFIPWEERIAPNNQNQIKEKGQRILLS